MVNGGSGEQYHHLQQSLEEPKPPMELAKAEEPTAKPTLPMNVEEKSSDDSGIPSMPKNDELASAHQFSNSPATELSALSQESKVVPSEPPATVQQVVAVAKPKTVGGGSYAAIAAAVKNQTQSQQPQHPPRTLQYQKGEQFGDINK